MKDETRIAEKLAGLLDAIIPVASAAGDAIRAVSEESADVETKADGSPLTRADLASHRTIQDGLESLDTGLPIVSEEGDVAGASENAHRTYWLVDPLDGTKEFLAGNGEYTVNIALVHEGRPVLGVVYLPTTRVTFFAAEHSGAYRRNSGDDGSRIRARRCACPERAAVSRSHLSDETRAFLARMGISEVEPRGSSLKMCAVAEGSVDIYPRLGPTCLWDTAAGAAVAREAGCKVVSLDGEPLSYDLADGIKHHGFLVYPSSIPPDLIHDALAPAGA